jgi:hypothetical protein
MLDAIVFYDLFQIQRELHILHALTSHQYGATSQSELLNLKELCTTG